MNESFQQAIREAFASCPSAEVTLETLEIRQSGVQEPIYIVRDRVELVAKDEDGNTLTFRPCGFQFALPSQNEDGFRSMSIAVDNIGREVSSFIKTALSSRVPVEVVYRPYLSSDLEGPQMIPPLVLYLTDITVTVTQVQAQATFLNLVNKKFPLDLYTRSRFPNLR